MKSDQIIIAIIILIIVEIKAESTCGKRLVDHEALITNGFPSNEGDWPWHAAIYHTSINQDQLYKCGGTLLNSNTVLTAAHCVHENNRPIIPERVSVQLGKYNLRLFSTNTQQLEVFNIIPHTEFNTSDLNNDIAILRLATQATLNNYVQPICLPNKLDIQELTGKLMTVIGWGFTETDQLSEVLRQAFMPVVSSITCLESNRNFFGSFLTGNNFCAGFRNGTSVCNGDSGGSISFAENGVYYIRGIVSLAMSRTDKNLCSTKEYVIFTDVSRYLPWIESVVPQIKDLPPSEEIKNCKIHYHAGCGYQYETFFNINDIRSGKNEEYALNMKFYISGSKDAHIYLGPVSDPSIGAEHYEIDVGVHWNTDTEIRTRKFMGDWKVMNISRTENILSVNENVPIHVKVRHDGTIEVSFPGTNFTTVTWKDDYPMPVNYIGFSSYLTETTFIFKCPTSDYIITPCVN